MQTHRNVTTGLYNAKRLQEKPIPQHCESDHEDDDDNNNFSIEEILIPAESNNDISLNNSTNETSNPLNMSSENSASNRAVQIVTSAETSDQQTETNGGSLCETTDENLSIGNELGNTNVSNVSDAASSSNTSQMQSNDKSIQSDQLDDSSLSQLPSTSGPSVHDANHLRMAEGSPNSSNILDDTQIVPSDATDVDSTDSGDRNLSFVQLEEPDITVNQTTSSNEIESKPVVVPLYEVHRANNEDILNQLEEWHVDYVDDDIEIIVSSKGYGGPLKTTLEGLVKLEKPDDFSGMIPYIITVSDF